MIAALAFTTLTLVGAGPVDAPVTPVPGTEMEFVLYFLDHATTPEGVDMYAQVSDDLALMQEAVEAFDLDLAAGYADGLVEIFTDLEDVAIAAPGNSTPLGVMVIDAMDTCGVAYTTTAAALRAVDLSAFDGAVAAIGDCNEDLNQATERMSENDTGLDSDSGDPVDSAYDAWLGLPAGDDLCPEFENGTLNDTLIASVYPGEDVDAVESVLAEHC